MHLELVTDLTHEAFMRCLSRFCSRLRKPSVVISDNSSTFTASRKILIKLFSTKEVQSYLANKKIRWKLLLEEALWQGGFFEKLIGTVKRTLKKVLRGERLNYEELLTVLNDIECTINCRPITHMSTDENIEPLCPSQLIIGRRILSLPNIADGECADEVVSQELLTKRMKYVNSVLQQYWHRWSKAYVVNLREFHKSNNKQNQMIVIPGEVVLVHDEKTPRQRWKIGRIIETQTSANGGVKVAVVNKKGRLYYLNRPVQRIYPLEIDSICDDPIASADEKQDSNRRLRRIAAANADLLKKLVDQ